MPAPSPPHVNALDLEFGRPTGRPDRPSIQNIQLYPKDPLGHSASESSRDPIQEEHVMTWSDSPWVLIYSVLVTLLMVSWAYIPA